MTSSKHLLEPLPLLGVVRTPPDPRFWLGEGCCKEARGLIRVHLTRLLVNEKNSFTSQLLRRDHRGLWMRRFGTSKQKIKLLIFSQAVWLGYLVSQIGMCWRCEGTDSNLDFRHVPKFVRRLVRRTQPQEQSCMDVPLKHYLIQNAVTALIVQKFNS